MNQSSHNIGIRCATTLPLAVYLDKDHIVSLNDSLGSCPGVWGQGAVELDTAFREAVEERVKATMTQLTVMDRTLVDSKNSGVINGRETTPDTGQSARTDKRSSCRDALKEISSRYPRSFCHVFLTCPMIHTISRNSLAIRLTRV